MSAKGGSASGASPPSTAVNSRARKEAACGSDTGARGEKVVSEMPTVIPSP